MPLKQEVQVNLFPARVSQPLARFTCGGVFDSFVFAAAICMLTFTTATYAQNLVTNPSFELPGFPLNPNYRYLNGANSTLLTGWTFVYDGVNEPSFVYHRTRYPVYAGDYSVALNDGDKCSTVIQTVPGCGYVLTITFLGIDGGAVRFQAGDLDITTNPNNGAIITPIFYSPGFPWKQKSFFFNAVVSSTTITISDVGQGLNFQGQLIDDISVVRDVEILAQPSSNMTCPLGTASFSVQAAGVASVTYQWQIELPGSPGTWSTLGNDPMPLTCGGFAHASPFNAATTNIGVNPCPGVSQYQIRCLVTNACGSVTSDTATLDVAGSCCSYPIDPRDTYLRTSQDPEPRLPRVVQLSDCAVSPGDCIRITRSGDFELHGIAGDVLIDALGIFSTDGVVLADPTQPNRVPGAVACALPPYVTVNTHFNALTTDVPQDFLLTGADVTVPAGAQFLIVSALDEYFSDNSDLNNDFAVNIQRTAGPAVLLQPASRTVCSNGSVTFTVAAANWGPFMYQWRKGGANLANGGRITGANTASLSISSVVASDAGSGVTGYDCVISNGCGSVTSDPATLSVITASTGDTNGDGLRDGRDIQAFVNVIMAGSTGSPTVARCAADMDTNGVVDSGDLSLFAAQLLNG